MFFIDYKYQSNKPKTPIFLKFINFQKNPLEGEL
jgi:hypothetical protein